MKYNYFFYNLKILEFKYNCLKYLLIMEFISNFIFSNNLDNSEFKLIKKTSLLNKLIEKYEFEMNLNEKKIFFEFLLKNLNIYKKSIINACIFSLLDFSIEINTNYNKNNNHINLLKSNNLKNINFIDWLIIQYFITISDDELLNNIINLLTNILSLKGIEKKILYKIINELSLKFFESKNKNNLNESLIYKYLNLLNIIFNSGNNVIKPYNFFFFNFEEFINFKILNEKNIIIIKESFCIIQSFNFLLNKEILLKLKNSKNEYIIISFKINKNDVKFFINDNEELFLNFNEQQILISKIDINKWNNLSMNFKINKNNKLNINIILNSNIIDIGTYNLLINKNEKIFYLNNFILYSNFIGLTTSFLLFNTIIDNSQILKYSEEFPFGIYKNKNLINFLDIYKTYLNNLIIFFIPCFNNKNNEFIYNLSKLENISIQFNKLDKTEKIINQVIINNFKTKNIYLLGGIKIIYPIFEILLEFNNEKIFEIFLNIINNILKNNSINYLIFQEEHFFEIFSLFLQKYSNKFFNNNIMKIFKEIYLRILKLEQKNNKNEIQQIFLDKIFFNKNIITKFSLKNQIELWEFLNNNMIFNKINKEIINFEKILILIKYYDDFSLNCCKFHLSYFNFDNKNKYIKEISNPELYIKLQYLIKILINLSFTNSKYLILLLNFLSCENSPCVYNIIFDNLIEYLLKVKNKNEKKNKYIKVLIKNKFLLFLLYLIHKIPFIEITSKIIKIFYILSSFKKNIYEIETFFNSNKNISFISNNILPIYTYFIIDFEKKNNSNLNNSFFKHFQKNIKINIEDNEFDKSINSLSNENNNSIISENTKLSNIKNSFHDYSYINLSNLEKSMNNNNQNNSFEIENIENLYEKEINNIKNLNLIIDFIPIKTLNSSINLLLSTLLEFLCYNNKENLINNEYILDIIIKLLSNKKCNILIIKNFLNDLENIIIKNKKININNCVIILSNLNFYHFFIELMFQSFMAIILIKNKYDIKMFDIITFKYDDLNELNKLVNNIFNKTLSLFSILIYNSNDSVYISSLDEIFVIINGIKKSAKIKNNDDKIIFENILNNFLTIIFKELLLYFRRNYEFNQNKPEINVINYIIAYIFEFMIFFNNNKLEDIINDKNNKNFFHNYLLKGINLIKTHNESSRIIEYWKDFFLYKNLIEIMCCTWEIKELNENCTNKFIKENILNLKKKNLFINNINILLKEIPKFNISLLELINNIFAISIKICKNENDLNEILSEYKKLILFCTHSCVNLTNDIEQYDIIQDKIYKVIYFSIFFISECYDKTSFKNFQTFFFNFLYDIIKNMIKLIINYNKLILKKFSFNKKINNINNSAIYKIINHKNNNKIFSKEILEKIFNNDEKFYNNYIKNILIPFLNCDINNKLKLDINQIFLIEKYYNLQNIRKNIKYIKIFENNNNNFYDIKYFKFKNQLNNFILNSLYFLEEEFKKFWEKTEINIFKYKLYYKKYKKNLFETNSFWFINNKKLLLKNINHFGDIFYRPILYPIFDLNNYKNKFMNNDYKNKDDYYINLDINEILKNENFKNEILLNVNEPENNLINENSTFYNMLFYNNYKKIYNYFFNIKKLFEENNFYIPKKSLIINEFKCYLIKQGYFNKGFLNINENFIIFYSFNNINYIYFCEQFEFEFYTKLKNNFQDTIKIIYLNDINIIFIRRFYFLKNSIEIFTKKNKMYFFTFESENFCNEIILKILNYFPQKIIEVFDTNKQNKIAYIFNSKLNNENLNYLEYKIYQWKINKISNFEMLNFLNIFSNRSYNDLTQYPIFPWIITNFININEKNEIKTSEFNKNADSNYNYNESIKIGRNFEIPVGMFELTEKSIKRKKFFIENYNKNKYKDFNYFYDNNYSNINIVSEYLIRLYPFYIIFNNIYNKENINKNNNIIFTSIQKAFLNAIESENDLREMIPEFFYMPEILMNINNLSLNNNILLENVVLPDWCENNAYKFIYNMRKYLEFNEISNKIIHWFDLIFGEAQQSIELNNIFYPTSYDFFDIEKYKEKKIRNFLFKKYNNGVCPNKIINKNFPKKYYIQKNKTNIKAEVLEYQLNLLKFKYKEKNKYISLKVLFICSINLNSIILLIDNFKFILFDFMIEEQNDFIPNKNLFELNYYIRKEDILTYSFLKNKNNNNEYNNFFPYLIFRKGTIIVEGGFYNGIIIISEIDILNNNNFDNEYNKNNINYIKSFFELNNINNFYDNSPIIYITIDSKEENIFFGSYYGTIFCYDTNNWEKLFNINNNFNLPILFIHLNNNLNVWGSTCMDGIINIYTFPTNKKIFSKQINEEKKYAKILFIFDNPYAGFIYFCNSDLNFYCYSITGKLIIIKEVKYFNIEKPIFTINENFENELIYINENGEFNKIKLPELNISPLNIGDFELNLFCVTKNKFQYVIYSEELDKIFVLTLNE